MLIYGCSILLFLIYSSKYMNVLYIYNSIVATQ